MREKIIRYEATGRGILSIKDAFYLASSSSPPVIHLPRSPLLLFPGTLSPPPTSSHLADHADTSQQPATSCYSKVISPDRCPSSFIPIDLPREQGTGQRAGKNVSRSRTILAVPLFAPLRGQRGGLISLLSLIVKCLLRPRGRKIDWKSFLFVNIRCFSYFFLFYH